MAQESKADPGLRPVAMMPLFPTLGSLQSVVDLGESLVPINDKNAVTALLMTYHNTLLAEIQK